MEEEMQKTQCDCHADVGTESRDMRGVQTYMGIVENNLVEVPNVVNDLLTQIISPENMNLAYKQVVGNGGSGGIDGMETKDLLPYLLCHKDELVQSLKDGKYRPNPVRRVEIPKDNGKKYLYLIYRNLYSRGVMPSILWNNCENCWGELKLRS